MTEIISYNDKQRVTLAYRWHGICKLDQKLLKELHVATNDCTERTSID